MIMTIAEAVARADRKIRPYVAEHLTPYATVFAYSAGRKLFLRQLESERPEPYEPPAELSRTMWGIRFRAPLMNAAGMFKNGGGYEVSYLEGAGGYLHGSSTNPGRAGNKKYGIKNPFIPLPRSRGAINWLGLNNDGDEKIIGRVSRLWQQEGCPVVTNLAESPDRENSEKTPALVRSLHKYANIGMRVFEVNYSCPNTGDMDGFEELHKKLRCISENFIKRRENVYVVVKFSNDTQIAQVPQVMDMLFGLGFHGVNFGNTSTSYGALVREIDPRDRELFNYFVTRFGGGVSGPALKEKSLDLCDHAVTYRDKGPPKQEFHVWRTGGVEGVSDLIDSDGVGVSMNLWFTGFFDRFSEYGHGLYERLFDDYHKRGI
jgi:dihydroorotate dehydrogenase